MPTFRGLAKRLRALVRREASDRALDDEMAFHIECETEKRVRAGVPHGEARRQALAAFGGVSQAREAHREIRGVPWLESIAADVRYAVRGLVHNRLITIAAMLTLTLGTGATTVVVTAVRSLFFQPTPVREPNRLFIVWQEAPRHWNPATAMGQGIYSYEHYVAFREGTKSVFEDVGAYSFGSVSLRTAEYARPLSALTVSANYFRVLGLSPALGRFPTPDDNASGDAGTEAVLGYEFWQREFAGDSAILGRTLYADSRTLSVIGVAPRGYQGPIVGLAADIFIPVAVYLEPPQASASLATARQSGNDRPKGCTVCGLTLIGRLRPELTHERAQTMLALAPPPVSQPGERWPWRVRLDEATGIPRMGRAPMAAFMGMLLITAGFVLLIAATNVAGMLLARATARRREAAIRIAIGASRARLVRQLVTESVLLCLGGAAGGVLLTRWVISTLPAVPAAISARIALNLRPDPVVLAVTLGIAVAAGILAGLAPALQATRFDLLRALRGEAAGRAARAGRMRTGFVVGQIALSLALMVTAGLFVRALRQALAVDPGLDPTSVVSARIDLGPHGYDTTGTRAFFEQLRTRLAARPEVAAVGFGRWTPLSGSANGTNILAPGEAEPDGKRINVTFGIADAGYFSAVRVPFRAGRSFSLDEERGGPPVVVINEVLAHRLWPNESALGRSFVMNRVSREVIGVVPAGRVRSLAEAPQAYVYLPFGGPASSATVFVRARGDLAHALIALRAEVAKLNPNVAVEQGGSLQDQMSVYVMPQRMAAWFVGAFGLVGLALACMGIYGVVAYHVAQRTREFGIRIALGARRRDVMALVERHALTLVGGGTIIGLLLAIAIGRLASGFLYGVGSADPVTFLSVPVLLAAVAFVASYFPARRASKVDPMESLRGE